MWNSSSVTPCCIFRKSTTEQFWNLKNQNIFLFVYGRFSWPCLQMHLIRDAEAIKCKMQSLIWNVICKIQNKPKILFRVSLTFHSSIVLVCKTICLKFFGGKSCSLLKVIIMKVGLTSRGDFLLYSQIELLIPSSWGTNTVLESKQLIRRECRSLKCFKL